MGYIEWRRIAHAQGQVVGEAVAVASGLALVPVVWATGTQGLFVIAAPILVLSIVRLLNRGRYGVWVSPAAIDFRGFLTRRIIRPESVERIVIDSDMAELLIRAGGSWKVTFVGFLRIKNREVQQLTKDLQEWLDSVDSSVEVEMHSPRLMTLKESLGRGYNSKGGAEFIVEWPRAWHVVLAVAIVGGFIATAWWLVQLSG